MSRAALFRASKHWGKGASTTSVQVVSPPRRMQLGSIVMPLISVRPEMSTTRSGAGRSPSAGKKSVPPDRIWPPCRVKTWTASSRVLGLEYKSAPHCNSQTSRELWGQFLYEQSGFVQRHGSALILVAPASRRLSRGRLALAVFMSKWGRDAPTTAAGTAALRKPALQNQYMMVLVK